jgi:archaeal flagellar protein FlaJ
MKFRIPFTISKDIEILKRKSKDFIKFTGSKKSKIDDYLQDSDVDVDRRQYLSICYKSFLINFLTISVFATSILGIFGADFFFFYGFGFALFISGFVLVSQVNYPRIYSSTKAKNIERNLISVLQDMMVQLNSGVPLFRILVNISESDYGEVSLEFEKITKEISSGVPQIEAIEKYGKRTTSKYFKRVLWQISNGMRAGSDMGIVIREGILALSEEQTIQIQSYGGKLNPLIMFYMLMAVIIPSLSITFLIIISSLLNVSEGVIKLVFFSIFGLVVFLQIMFLGVIRSRRPSLL